MATDFQLRHAASTILHGGVITCPTDTIYGLSCDPYNAHAVSRLFDIKQRPLNKSMILLASEVAHIEAIADTTKLPADFDWCTDSPTTWVMPASEHCPAWLRHRDNTVAVRLTNYPLIRRLCKQLDSSIVSTSANFSGMPPVTNKITLHRFFQPLVDAMLFCNIAGTGKPSIIKHYSDQRILRHST